MVTIPPPSGKTSPGLQKSGMTFMPDSWQKPPAEKAPPVQDKSGMTAVPDSWLKEAGGKKNVDG
jgi:hypothetical protein